MSSYTLRLWFSGLVHFVENKDPNAKCQLCVVLPRAAQHVGAIYEPNWVVRCGNVRLAKGDLVATLERRRIAFEISRVDDLPPIDQPFKSSFPGLLSMEDITGIFADENDQIVSAKPPGETVLAQILVGKGYVTGFDSDISVRRTWTVPSTLTGFQLLTDMYDPVYVDIPDIKKVRLIDEPIDPEGEKREPIELQPNKERLIELFVSNRCEASCLTRDDIDIRMEPSRFTIIQKDRDFAYNYQMFHPETLKAMKKALGIEGEDIKRLPVPESPLFEIILAPHLCFDYDKDGEDEKNQAEKEAGFTALGLTRLLQQARTRALSPDFLDIILELVKTGTGTGSGSDCMGGRGKARFTALDPYIPGPDLPADMALLHAQQKQERTGSARAQQQNGVLDSGGQGTSIENITEPK